jgi:hypothetical protein
MLTALEARYARQAADLKPEAGGNPVAPTTTNAFSEDTSDEVLASWGVKVVG